MAQSTDEIIGQIAAYVSGGGLGDYGWYVGITGDPRTRLFEQHQVNEKGFWIYRQAMSGSDARAIERHLLTQPGFTGGSGGGDARSVYVYAYKITILTVEDA